MRILLFGPFRLDVDNVELWNGATPVMLRNKAWAILSYLAHHPGRLVSKQELLDNVWRGSYVTTVALRVCVREVRIALGDTAKSKQYIQTQGQLGYRFIANVEEAAPADEAESLACRSNALLVGRGAELKQLNACLANMVQGDRQVVFVTGEAGLGKTTVMQAFVEEAALTLDAWVGIGQCVEHYGPSEPYRPVLEALSRLCRGPRGTELIDLLSRYAPSWLVQIPGLMSAEAADALLSRDQAPDQERMLRELAEALDVVTCERPLLLVLEDLHWSDHATVELLAVIARRREPARLLVLASYRPPDVLAFEHCLLSAKQELQLHNHCADVELTFLTETAVGDYLMLRFPDITPLAPLARLVHRKTEGNPLFMVNTVDALVSERLIAQVGSRWLANEDELRWSDVARNIPHSLKQTIELQLGRLDSTDQNLLRAASVAGVEFDTAMLCAAIASTQEGIEEQCEELARRWPFISTCGLSEWPDGTLTSRYRFSHALYQSVSYEQLATARRVRLHGLIGERLEIGYVAQTSEIAADLAAHFIEARDTNRAVHYLHLVAKNALQRQAVKEAIDHLSRGMTLLNSLPASGKRDQRELDLALTLGPLLMKSRGYSAPEVRKLYDRARQLCQGLNETPKAFHAMMGLWSYYLVRSELTTAYKLAQDIYNIAQDTQEVGLRLSAHYTMANTLGAMGEDLQSCHHADQGIALYDPLQHHDLADLYAADPGMMCHCLSVLRLWRLGYADQARQKGADILRLAESLDHTYSLIHTLGFTSVCLLFGRDLIQLDRQAKKMISLAEAESFPFWLAAGHLLHGWVLVQQGKHQSGMAEVRKGISDSEATGARIYRSYYLGVLADSCAAAGEFDEGLNAIERALEHVEASGERVHEAELHRLRGVLLLQRVKAAGRRHSGDKRVELEIEACFLRARDIAARQQAKFFELRAVSEIYRLWQEQGRQQQALPLLKGTYDWFTEGFDTHDLQTARRLLDEHA